MASLFCQLVCHSLPSRTVVRLLWSDPMSSTVMLPNRLPLIAALILLVNSIGGVLSAAYTRADDIEPFGL